ncbi:MAG: hypothetical protein RR869_07650 [Lachnospiraceae bacterium]
MGRKIRITGIVVTCFLLLCSLQSSAETSQKGFLLLCEEPNGQQGYYVTKPEVDIVHQDVGYLTGYRLERADGTTEEGRLSKPEERISLREALQEGSQILTVWLQDMDGNVISGYGETRKIIMDTQSPELDVSAQEGFEAWYTEDVLMNVRVQALEQDGNAGKVKCFVDGTLVQQTQESTTFVVNQPSQGGAGVPIRVEAIDEAGNQTVVEKLVYLDKKAPTVSITGIKEDAIVGTPVEISCQTEEENGWENIELKIVREGINKTVESVIPGEWENVGGKKVLSQTLFEDGIYRMEFHVEDQAGHKAACRAQIMIDQTSPVIRYVENLNGRVLQAFAWNYQMGETISDHTTFQYEMKLDGRTFGINEKNTREGIHVFRIQAVDEAGNQSEVEAEFLIDHTKPRLRIKGIENGESYQGQAEVTIRLNEKNDFMENIVINGVSQKLESQSESYQYTFDKPGVYEIEMVAKDLAGNKKTEHIKFQVIETENWIQKTMRFFQKAFSKKGGGQVA